MLLHVTADRYSRRIAYMPRAFGFQRFYFNFSAPFRVISLLYRSALAGTQAIAQRNCMALPFIVYNHL